MLKRKYLDFMFDDYKYTIERTCFKLLIISHYNVFLLLFSTYNH